MSYPGGKGASGVAQKIISMMPPHDWMNFNPDEIPRRHDWRFWGDSFRERERLQKKLKRLRRKLAEVGTMERNYLLDGISDLYESFNSVVSNPE